MLVWVLPMPPGVSAAGSTVGAAVGWGVSDAVAVAAVGLTVGVADSAAVAVCEA
jgi:hypothetical protein